MPIAFENVSHTYSAGTPYEYQALRNINLEITEGKMTAIIGQTGSGKSTLVQHLNALLLPDAGIVHILDRDIKAGEKAKKLKALRGEVGLVFQFAGLVPAPALLLAAAGDQRRHQLALRLGRKGRGATGTPSSISFFASSGLASP